RAGARIHAHSGPARRTHQRRYRGPRGLTMNRARKSWWMPALLLAGPLAPAHIASKGFLSLEAGRSQISGVLELAIRDGELAVGLDHDGDGKVTWGELRASQAALQA